MTINSTNFVNQFNGDGTTTSFVYQFRIIDEEDIIVIITDATGNDVTQVLGVNYTVTGVGDDAGGSVIFNTAPVLGTRVTLASDAEALQPEHYVENDEFPASAHEVALDRVTTVSRSALEQTSRSIQVPYGTNRGAFDNLLPPIVTTNGGKAVCLKTDASGFEFVTINSIPITQGDVNGPASSTDNAITRFDGTTGKTIQNSTAILEDDGTLTLNSAAPGALVLMPYGNGAGQTSEIRFQELTTSGSNFISIKSPDTLTSTNNYILPNNSGSAGQALVTDGSGNLSWATTGGGGGGATWLVVTSNTVLAVGNYYIANSATPIDLALPTTCAVGDTFKIIGIGAGVFSVLQNVGQQIIFGSEATTLGLAGALVSTNQYDAVEFTCVVTDTTFVVTSGVGNFTLI